MMSPPDPPPQPLSSRSLPARSSRRQPGITIRVLLLGGLLIPLTSFWIIQLERVMFGPYPSTISLFANVVFVLFLLAGVNAGLKRFAPRFAFSQGELLTLYTMLAIATGLAGSDGIPILTEIIPHGAWFGPTSHWDAFLGAFPSWLVVRDRAILRGHYLGNSSFYQVAVLRAWITPILCWTLFITLLLLVAQCTNVLIRRQWADRERLTFPIVWLPIEMTEEGAGAVFFANRLMWAGFAVAALLGLWNGIAFLYPSLPMLPIGITDLKPLFTAKPWKAIDWFPITFYPLVIGLGFLLPLDLLFSCWFFFLLWKAQVVISSAEGWDATPDFPFIKEQGFGAAMGLFAVYLWTGRRYLADIWRRAWRRPSPRASEDPDTPQAPEALSERWALIGLGIGVLALLGFCRAAGVAWWVAAAFLALYLPMLVVVTRIRAELGSPVHDFHFMGPDNMLPRALGTTPLQSHDLAFFTFSYSFTRAHRSDTMPIGLEGLQMAKLRQIDMRRMFGAILLATVLGTLSSFWAFEHQAYHLGAAGKFSEGYWMAQESFERMANWTDGTLARRPNFGAVTAMGFSALVTIGLFSLRMRFFGFPLHPIGYAVSSSWAIHLVWMPLLIAWLLKGSALRYGGLRAYRRFLPFFLGLILGDCVVGSMWALLSLLWHMRTYNFFGA
ncbi:MAG TPA: DUF6785 family protein [Chthonomonadaceae bacterium]|nr:DUF6785 family protein [Chthonomonadaceae bacterium]